jgi:hypothetical protein
MHYKKISLLGAFATLMLCTSLAQAERRESFEIWLVDQSNTRDLAYGGAIHVYDGHTLITKPGHAVKKLGTINLAAATAQLCFAATGAFPVRPHMLFFNSKDTHAALSFVASGHVVIFDAHKRRPLACFRTEVGAGGARQAHAAWHTRDNSYLIVANQNGKKLERIRTDYANNQYAQEPEATLDLAGCSTPNGLPCQSPELRPDNAPICGIVGSDNGPTFVSLRGGGMFVVDWRATPMKIVSEYDLHNVPSNGCGFTEAQGWVYGNGGGGTPNNLDQFTVYRVPVSGHGEGGPISDPATQILLNDDSPERDAHGVATSLDDRYVWVGDRDGNVIEVFDSMTGTRVNTINLLSGLSADPTPDLFATSPDKAWVFVSTRGPNPLSGDPHSSHGEDPGLLVMSMKDGGATGELRSLVRISNIDAGGVERADAHGIAMRRLPPR